MADLDTPGSRDYLTDLLTRWRDGTVSSRDVFTETKALWLSRQWPKPTEPSEAIAFDVLFLLATARDMGITHDDIPALLEYLDTPPGQEVHGRERFYAYVEGIDSLEREALQATDYYGPASAEADESLEIGIGDPDQRRIHRAIRLDPESVWDELRAQFCAPQPRDEDFLVDAVQDLMYTHADVFIDRIEQLADDCPEARQLLAIAYLGGVAATPAAERFRRLQDRLESELSGDVDVLTT